MAYVHEECILDWISTKMAQDDAPLVPFCEICRTPYSARLRAGSRKLSFERLRDKLCHLRLSEKWLAIYFLLGTIFSLYLVAKIFLQLLCLLGEWIWDYESNFSL
jgi:E3 ubiquitin-protein ligase DOA10